MLEFIISIFGEYHMLFILFISQVVFVSFLSSHGIKTCVMTFIVLICLLCLLELVNLERHIEHKYICNKLGEPDNCIEANLKEHYKTHTTLELLLQSKEGK